MRKARWHELVADHGPTPSGCLEPTYPTNIGLRMALCDHHCRWPSPEFARLLHSQEGAAQERQQAGACAWPPSRKPLPRPWSRSPPEPPDFGRTGVASTVEMMSWYLSVDSISDTMRAGLRSVAINAVIRHTTIPVALMSSGYCIATYRWLLPSEDSDEMTSAAQVDSANEPNRSAPMPAMSPTLSPTLSARQRTASVVPPHSVGASACPDCDAC